MVIAAAAAGAAAGHAAAGSPTEAWEVIGAEGWGLQVQGEGHGSTAQCRSAQVSPLSTNRRWCRGKAPFRFMLLPDTSAAQHPLGASAGPLLSSAITCSNAQNSKNVRQATT
jgi:hypothetical protein